MQKIIQGFNEKKSLKVSKKKSDEGHQGLEGRVQNWQPTSVSLILDKIQNRMEHKITDIIQKTIR